MGPGRKISSGVAWVAALAALGGCLYDPPALRVTGARVVERSDEGYVLRVTIEGENPNAVELPMRRVDYRVDLDGREVFRGTRSAEATLPRRGSHVMELPAAVPGPPPGPGARFGVRGTLRYVTPGEIAQILFDTGVNRPKVGFSGEGVVEPGEVDAPRADDGAPVGGG